MVGPVSSTSHLTPSDLEAALSGDPNALDVHLELVERDVVIDGHQVKVHCHCLTIDANGTVQLRRLAEFMRDSVADYAIPRHQLQRAKLRDEQFKSTDAVSALVERAKRSFTDLATTGEGGELLLFILAQRFLKLPQILCKMDLKTDPRMHYHGADGVYAGVTTDGILKLYWGESKIFKNPNVAIDKCLSSLAPFLGEEDHEGAERERDLLLLSDKADLSEPDVTDALRRYFDKSSKLSKRVRYCGVALVGFEVPFYPNTASTPIASVANTARVELEKWKTKIGSSLKSKELSLFEIQLLCVPLPSANEFRSSFLRAMGLNK